MLGAGPAGLSCAVNLAQKKYPVTVFERASGWGGTLRTHPDFAAFDEDISLQFSVVDANFKFDKDIKSLEELGGYDAVYVATGENGETFGLLDSWDSELMTTANPKVFIGGSVSGAPLMTSIAQGRKASKIIETFFQTR